MGDGQRATPAPDGDTTPDVEQRLARYEALVRQQLCKCVVGSYWVAHNNCPLHANAFGLGASADVILRDQRGYVASAADRPLTTELSGEGGVSDES